MLFIEWIIVQYKTSNTDFRVVFGLKKRKLKVRDSGRGGISGVIARLSPKSDKLLYAFLRSDTSKSCKVSMTPLSLFTLEQFMLITWIGEKAPALYKARGIKYKKDIRSYFRVISLSCFSK
jgi:hypothetical protein